MVLCLTFITGNSYSSLFLKSLLIQIHWLLPAMVLLLLLLLESGSIVFVTVSRKVSLTVPVTVTFPSLIVTSDGIHPVPVFIMGTIYICWLLLIQKATFLFSLCWILPQDMIPTAFCIPFSEWKAFCLNLTYSSCFLILHMMSCLFINTVNAKELLLLLT